MPKTRKRNRGVPNSQPQFGAGSKPTLFVFNKCDKADTRLIGTKSDDTVFISAKTGEGTEELVALMEKTVSARKKRLKFLIPHDKSGLLNILYSNSGSNVESVEYTERGTSLVAVCDERTAGKLSEFIVGE